MQKETITLTIRVEKEEVKNKIIEVWRSYIPMQNLIEELILKADLNHYKKLLEFKS